MLLDALTPPRAAKVPVSDKVARSELKIKAEEPEISPLTGAFLRNCKEYSGPSATSTALAVTPVKLAPSP